jgi:hypothetical protein
MEGEDLNHDRGGGIEISRNTQTHLIQFQPTSQRWLLDFPIIPESTFKNIGKGW